MATIANSIAGPVTDTLTMSGNLQNIPKATVQPAESLGGKGTASAQLSGSEVTLDSKGNASVKQPSVITAAPATAEVSQKIMPKVTELDAQQKAQQQAAQLKAQQAKMAATSSTATAQQNMAQQGGFATLYDPTNPNNKVVVPVGSDISNTYTSAGWGLSPKPAEAPKGDVKPPTEVTPTGEAKPPATEVTPTGEPKAGAEGAPGTYAKQQADAQAKFDSSMEAANQKADNDLAEVNNKFKQIEEGTYPLTADQQAMIDSIKNSFQSLIEAQKVANANYQGAVTRAGISAGRNMYAPEIEHGIIKGAIDSGISKIADLNVKMASAVLEAKMAYEDKNYGRLKDTYERISKIQESKRKEIENTYNMAKDAMAAAKDDHDRQMADQQFEFEKEKEANKPILEADARAQEYAYNMAQKYPDAGIGPKDTIVSITQKIQASQSYKDELSKSALERKSTEADIAYKQAQSAKAYADAKAASGAGTGGGTAAGTKTVGGTDVSAVRAQIAATKGLTKDQRAALLNLFDEQGVEGVKTWAYNNLGAVDKQSYDANDNASMLTGLALRTLNEGVAAGPYKALLESKKPWLLLKRDKAYVDLMSQVELGQAQIRRALYGTAVTESEAGQANKFLVNDTDDFATIQQKLKNNSEFLKFANDAKIARALGLPHPDISNYLTGSGGSAKTDEKAAAQSAKVGSTVTIGGVKYRKDGDNNYTQL
jgi:hypothetical protein